MTYPDPVRLGGHDGACVAQAVLSASARCADAGDDVAFGRHFAADAAWCRDGRVLAGRREIADTVRRTPGRAVRHLLGALRVLEEGEGYLVVESHAVVVSAPEGTTTLVDYRDRLERIDGRWLIVERTTTVLR